MNSIIFRDSAVVLGAHYERTRRPSDANWRPYLLSKAPSSPSLCHEYDSTGKTLTSACIVLWMERKASQFMYSEEGDEESKRIGNRNRVAVVHCWCVSVPMVGTRKCLVRFVKYFLTVGYIPLHKYPPRTFTDSTAASYF